MSTPENTAAVLGTSWPEVFRALTVGEDLSDDVAAWAMGEMMAGDATEGQVGGFLLALAAKGVTVPELRGLTEAAHTEDLRINLLFPARASGGEAPTTACATRCAWSIAER